MSITFLQELGKLSAKAISALAGLVPYAKDSRKMRGYRTTKGNGRSSIKKALFLPTQTAVRYNKNLSNFYKKKIKEGKRPMAAITACMRKMLIQLNSIIKKGRMDF